MTASISNKNAEMQGEDSGADELHGSSQSNSAANDEIASNSIELSLDRLFVFQNAQTGEVSSTHLSAGQLCRLLCPPSGNHGTQKVTADSNVLPILPDGSYSQEWKTVKETPLLRQAITSFYVNNEGQEAYSKGPLSCRQLAALLKSNEISLESLVFVSGEKEWRPLGKCTEIQVAINAFLESTSSRVAPLLSASTAVSPQQDDIQKELEAFLSSTRSLSDEKDDEDEEEQSYKSSDGTRYVKDISTGNWVHEALIAPGVDASTNLLAKQQKRPSETVDQEANKKKKKNKKAQFSARNARRWIYASGLPTDATMEEAQAFFSKAGILDLDPESQRPKIKLYRDKESGQGKGDASVCYARVESVDLALTILDEAPFRPNDFKAPFPVCVQRAQFEAHTDGDSDNRVTTEDKDKAQNRRRRPVAEAKRKVAKLAILQAMDWDENGENGRLTGGRKGLCIIVLKHLFDPSTFLSEEHEDQVFQELEARIREECEKWGVVEKITVFSKNPEGVVVVKFAQPTAASEAIQSFNGRILEGRTIEASYWDGVSDYTIRDEEKEILEESRRVEEFGNWLERQGEELPDELKPKTE